MMSLREIVTRYDIPERTFRLSLIVTLALPLFLTGLPVARAESQDAAAGNSLGIVREVYVGGVEGKFNGWNGYVDGKLYSVAAGYLFADPSAGLVIVSDSPADGGDYYYTPKTVGPMEIVGERNGVLELRSKVGRFERAADDAGNGSGFTRILRSVVYHFDLRKRVFTE